MSTNFADVSFVEGEENIYLQSIDNTQHQCGDIEFGAHGVTFTHVDASPVLRVFMPYSYIRAIHQEV